MGIARSSSYAAGPAGDDTALVAAITVICDEFEAYGWCACKPRSAGRGSHRPASLRLLHHGPAGITQMWGREPVFAGSRL